MTELDEFVRKKVVIKYKNQITETGYCIHLDGRVIVIEIKGTNLKCIPLGNIECILLERNK